MTIRRDESGQAAAELAAVFPIVLLLIVLFVEVGAVLLDQLALQHVAREAARAAAVTPSVADVQHIALAASDLSRERVQVRVGPRPDDAGMVRVDVAYEARVVEPFTGAVLFRPQLHAFAAMRVETP